ncbi:MAG TPA: beta-propeller fold lactonase family protein [Solirubrobacteraceae bacterium]|jgi:DNA-binding beta-propeller fold protein YncE|nr:beta-propeller fold lactonase family protein [Solirubrobacteraceae bacterium]
MKARTRLGSALAIAAGALAATGGAASAAGTGHALFVQTDNIAGNQIAVYDRAADGTLTAAATYPTGGLGGALSGSVVDHLASQGSLTYDRANGLLYAVNAGSNTISVFAVIGDRLALRQVLSSGGSFPVSVDAANGLVYVLNAEEGGSLQGFRVSGGYLTPIPGSVRTLGLDPEASPQFTNTPGQVAFSPSGTQLIVTTKANEDDIDVFRVNAAGRLSASPTVNQQPGAVPFAVSFDQQGDLVAAEAGPNALASFVLKEDGTLAQLDTVASGQQATCWLVPVGKRFYASSAGSASLSGFQTEAHGQLLSLFSTTATDAGTVDAAAPDGRFLYVQAGAAGIVDEFAIGTQGALSPIGSVTVPGAAGGEGIAAP